MQKLIYDMTGRHLIRSEQGVPVCGEDFCDSCGDCLDCYGDDVSYCSHSWIEYIEADVPQVEFELVGGPADGTKVKDQGPSYRYPMLGSRPPAVFSVQPLLPSSPPNVVIHEYRRRSCNDGIVRYLHESID